jgi:hypothetical protein
MNIVILALYTFLVVVPFGYWRAASVKFSMAWLAAIHVPVFLIVPVRRWILEVSPVWLFVMIPVFFLGQRFGATIRERWLGGENARVSACMVMDFYHRLRHKPSGS